MAPSTLANGFHSLPPMLHRPAQNSVLSCSKGAQGLSVLPWGTGVCTGTSKSLSLSLRQRPGRWTIRAGRNLPDKEFRYLRTVIVTAAVYWGFGLQLRSAEAGLTAPLNLPALGRLQTLYVRFDVCRVLCF